MKAKSIDATKTEILKIRSASNLAKEKLSKTIESIIATKTSLTKIEDARTKIEKDIKGFSAELQKLQESRRCQILGQFILTSLDEENRSIILRALKIHLKDEDDISLFQADFLEITKNANTSTTTTNRPFFKEVPNSI